MAGTGYRKPYVIAAVIIIAGYLAFFTSRLWMPEGRPLEYSAIGEQYRFESSDTVVTLIDWEYSPKEAKMLVEFDLDGVEAAEYAAVEKAGKRLAANEVLAGQGTHVVELSNVPDDFTAVSFRIRVLGETMRLYTNEVQVRRAESLPSYGSIEACYQARAIRNAAAAREQIAVLTEAIASEQEKAEGYAGQIAQKRERLPYLNRKQREQAEQLIGEMQQKIQGCEDAKEQMRAQILELEQEAVRQEGITQSADVEGESSE